MRMKFCTLVTLIYSVFLPLKVQATDFNWKQKSGSSITVMLSAHPIADSLKSREAEFENLTGIDVIFDELPEGDYFVKLKAELASRSDSVDVFMTGPSSNWEYANGGWINDLQPFIDNRSKTDADWDFSDFYEGGVNTNRWTGEEFGGVGSGPLYAIPVAMESYHLNYRADVLKANGVAVPDTVEDLIAAAAKLDGIEHNGNRLDGFVARGTEFWPILITGYGSVLFAYGASDLDADGSSGADSPEAIAGTKAWAELMQYTPDGIAAYDWNAALNHYIGGNAVFFLDANNMAPTIMDPEKSSVADVNAFANPPAGPAGRASGLWLWSLGMNAATDNADAAWMFIQWATGKEEMKQLIRDGAINPTRASVATSDVMEELAGNWPNFLEVLDANSRIARWRWNPSTRFSEVGNRWAEAVQQIYLADVDAEEALGAAAEDIDEIMASTR